MRVIHANGLPGPLRAAIVAAGRVRAETLTVLASVCVAAVTAVGLAPATAAAPPLSLQRDSVRPTAR